MASEWRQGEPAVSQAMRLRQEREIGATHNLLAAEHALAAEACAVGRELARAGFAFDPLTFVALRVLESSVDAVDDPVEILAAPAVRALVARSAERARLLLEDAA